MAQTVIAHSTPRTDPWQGIVREAAPRPIAATHREEKRVPVQPKGTGTSTTKIEAMVSNGHIGRRLLKVEDAAEYLGLSVETLHKWVQERTIPHVKAGRALRFDLVALNRYIDEHTIRTID